MFCFSFARGREGKGKKEGEGAEEIVGKVKKSRKDEREEGRVDRFQTIFFKKEKFHFSIGLRSDGKSVMIGFLI